MQECSTKVLREYNLSLARTISRLVAVGVDGM